MTFSRKYSGLGKTHMELSDLIGPLRKWWWLILLTIAIAGGSSYVATRNQPAVYAARSTLIVGGSTIDNPNPSANTIFLSQQLARIYADIAQREPIKDATKEALGMTWLPSYVVAAVSNSQLLEIVVEDTDSLRAQVVANELAQQLIKQGPSATDAEEHKRLEFVNSQLDNLEEQIEETELEITDKQSQLAELFSARQIADTKDQISALEGKLRTLQSNYSTLLTNSRQGATNSISVFELATEPVEPSGPNQYVTILIAAGIGFALSAAAAYLLEYFDDTVKSPEDIRRYTGLPTLAGIADQRNGSENERIISLAEPRSPVTEAFRTLRTGIQFSSFDEQIKKLVVTSSNPGEGKSVTSANLAVVMAQAGHTVLLVDSDLRRPKQHQLFDINLGPGLSSFLFDMDSSDEGTLRTLVDSHVQATQQPNLFLMTAGHMVPNPSELLGSARMRTAVKLFGDIYDFVIFDSPPILAVTDPVVLGTQVDSVILTVHANKTRKDQLERAVARLQDVKVNILGTVINRLGASAAGYQYYYYAQNPSLGKQQPDETTYYKSNGTVTQPQELREPTL